MAATLWDSFEYLTDSAENHFLEFQFDKAIEEWTRYYEITAKVEYKKLVEEITHFWDNKKFAEIQSLSNLFLILQEYRHFYRTNRISHYTYTLYQKLCVKIYVQYFSGKGKSEISLETGIFEYLAGNPGPAIQILEKVLDQKYDSQLARIYIGYAHMAYKDQRSAIAVLTQNLFFAADQLDEDDLYLSQFKLLAGKLRVEYNKAEAAAWMLTFESWYRNWLIFHEDDRFLALMRKKESNERIMQVKYSQTERFRHFMHCLYITEYARQLMPREKGLIVEQETYMEKLDSNLFSRFRKKRKTISS